MPVNRQYDLYMEGASLFLPCYFPSVSSVKTNLLPVHYIELLDAAAHPLFLVSAYDLYTASEQHKPLICNALLRAKQKKAMILLDCGNYERFWKGDGAWDINCFHSVCQSHEQHLCFCYDNQNPPDTSEAIAEDVIKSVLRDQEHAKGTVVPIVHGPAQLLPKATSEVAGKLYPVLLAVPERALGEGIFDRARTVRKIRLALNELGYYCPLHLLGTGNPISLLIYSIAGADSFDGLEWCQTAVDHDTGLLYHFHQWDFLSDQTMWGKYHDLPYIQSALMHNLAFYNEFMKALREAIMTERAEDFLKRYLPSKHASTVMTILD